MPFSTKMPFHPKVTVSTTYYSFWVGPIPLFRSMTKQVVQLPGGPGGVAAALTTALLAYGAYCLWTDHLDTHARKRARVFNLEVWAVSDAVAYRSGETPDSHNVQRIRQVRQKLQLILADFEVAKGRINDIAQQLDSDKDSILTCVIIMTTCPSIGKVTNV